MECGFGGLPQNSAIIGTYECRRFRQHADFVDNGAMAIPNRLTSSRMLDSLCARLAFQSDLSLS